MGDFEAKQRTFVLSLVSAYSSNLDNLRHVLDVLGSFTGDCPKALHSMGSSLFQQEPALLDQFFCLYPWARHPGDHSAVKDDPSGKYSEETSRKCGLNVDKITTLKKLSPKHVKLNVSDVSLCSTVTTVLHEMSSPMKLEINGDLKRKVAKDSESVTAKKEYKIMVHEDMDEENANTLLDKEMICGNRRDLKCDNTSKNDIKIDKTDKPLRRSSRVVKVPLDGYKNDLPKDVLLLSEISDSCDDYKAGHQSDSADNIVESENDDHSFESENDQCKNSKNETELVGERTCPKCLKIFKERKYMKRHCKEIINCNKTRLKLPVSCPKCEKVFKKRRYLNEHIRLIDCQKIERISCSKCQLQFKSKKYLREHSRLKKCQTTVKPFQCPKCNKSFGKKSHLTQHKNKNVNCQEKKTRSTKLQKCGRQGRPPQFQCPKCPRSFNDKGHLTMHMNKKVKCDQVKKLSNQAINSEINTLSNIVVEEHERQEKDRSNEDVKEGKNEREDNHILKKCIKLSENEFQCPQCEKVFATIRKLRWHRMKVHDSDPCICPYCSKSFATKETLSRHVCKVNPLLIKCDVCDASFEEAFELSVHLGIVHNRVSCSQCTRNFANPQNLLQHYELVHETRFTCDQCSSSFTKKHNLLEHIRQVHLKMWLFPCLECKKEGISTGFKRKTYWKNHMEKRHSQMDIEACFDQSFREAFLGTMAEEGGGRSDALETNWESIREAVWEEEWEKSGQVDSME